MITKDTIVKSMLWSAYGDALGFITELSTKSQLTKRTHGISPITKLIPWTRRIGGKFGVYIDLPAGCYSDDTQLRLATCRSILGNGKFDVETFSKIELPIWLSYSLGAGKGTKIAAEELKKNQVQWHSNFYDSFGATYVNSGGNGAAMRIQPHVWSASPDKKIADILKDVIRNTIVTHGHCRAIVGAAFHAVSLHYALDNECIPSTKEWLNLLQAIKQIPSIINNDKELTFYWLSTWENKSGVSIQKAMDRVFKELEDDIFIVEELLNNGNHNKDNAYRNIAKKIGGLDKNSNGSATKTSLLALVLSYLYQANPLEGIIICVNLLGSDTDTIATMAGAIFGITAKKEPPQELLDNNYIIKEAERLFDIRERRETNNHKYPDMLYWNAPKTQLDTIANFNNNFVAVGFGEVKPKEITGNSTANDSTIWQWFEFNFGQTILLKRRNTLPEVDPKLLPIRSSTKFLNESLFDSNRDDQYKKSETVFENVEKNKIKQVSAREREILTVDKAVELCYRSNLNNLTIGNMLSELSLQEDGLEKAIGFAAIVAKAKQIKSKRTV